jgi:hypothetical protein
MHFGIMQLIYNTTAVYLVFGNANILSVFIRSSISVQRCLVIQSCPDFKSLPSKRMCQSDKDVSCELLQGNVVTYLRVNVVVILV